jgi:hypothetical protein
MRRKKREATLKDWMIVKYPEVAAYIGDYQPVFTKYADALVAVIIGNTVDDKRFADGTLIITSPIIEAQGDKYITLHTLLMMTIKMRFIVNGSVIIPLANKNNC